MALGLSAQTLSLSQAGMDYSNDTLYLTGNTEDFVLEAHMTIRNNADKAVEVIVGKTEIQVVPETENSFCWGVCYPPYIYEATQAIVLEGGETDTGSFYGDYTPAGKPGTSIIRYTFRNAAQLSDSVSVVVSYQVGAAGIVDWTVQPSLLKAWPNPTTGILHVDFPGAVNQSVSLRLMSITGQTVLSRTFEYGQNSATLQLADLPKGYYFLEIREINGFAAQRKILKAN